MPTVIKQEAKKAPVNSKAPAKASVVDRITPLEEGLDTTIKMLIYGRSGTGKTTLWATFPGPILAVICSGGNKPGELKSINEPKYRNKVKKVSIDNMEEFYAVVEHCKGYRQETTRR